MEGRIWPTGLVVATCVLADEGLWGEKKGKAKMWVCSQEIRHWVLCLERFYLFSKGGDFRVCLRGGFSTEYAPVLQVCPVRVMFSTNWPTLG